MENNQLPKIDNKLLIKKILANTAAAIVFGLILIFISYGKAIPVKATLIAIGICIVVLPTSILFAAKYRNYITPDKIRKFFLILGILMVIVNLTLIIIGGGKNEYYLGIALGFYFISGPSIYKPTPPKN